MLGLRTRSYPRFPSRAKVHACCWNSEPKRVAPEPGNPAFDDGRRELAAFRTIADDPPAHLWHHFQQWIFCSLLWHGRPLRFRSTSKPRRGDAPCKTVNSFSIKTESGGKAIEAFTINQRECQRGGHPPGKHQATPQAAHILGPQSPPVTPRLPTPPTRRLVNMPLTDKRYYDPRSVVATEIARRGSRVHSMKE